MAKVMDSKWLVFFGKILLVNTLLFFSTNSIFAQAEENPTIGILKLSATDVEEEEAQQVSNRIETAFFNSRRFQIVTRQFLAAIKAERERNKEAVNLDEIALEQGVAIGANYIVKGEVTRYDRNTYRSRGRATTSNKQPIPKIYTSTLVHFDLQIIEVKTGIIKASDTYEGSLNEVDHHVKNFIRKEFPFRFTVLEVIEKGDKRKVKTTLLDGGFRQGLHYGVLLDVYEEIPESVEGTIYYREVELGEMYVKAVDFSGNFAECNVRKGRKTILKKIEEGKTIICKVPKKLRMLGINFEYTY